MFSVHVVKTNEQILHHYYYHYRIIGIIPFLFIQAEPHLTMKIDQNDWISNVIPLCVQQECSLCCVLMVHRFILCARPRNENVPPTIVLFNDICMMIFRISEDTWTTSCFSSHFENLIVFISFWSVVITCHYSWINENDVSVHPNWKYCFLVVTDPSQASMNSLVVVDARTRNVSRGTLVRVE